MTAVRDFDWEDLYNTNRFVNDMEHKHVHKYITYHEKMTDEEIVKLYRSKDVLTSLRERLDIVPKGYDGDDHMRTIIKVYSDENGVVSVDISYQKYRCKRKSLKLENVIKIRNYNEEIYQDAFFIEGKCIHNALLLGLTIDDIQEYIKGGLFRMDIDMHHETTVNCDSRKRDIIRELGKDILKTLFYGNEDIDVKKIILSAETKEVK